MADLTLTRDLPERVANYLPDLPRAEQSPFAVSAVTKVLSGPEGEAPEGEIHPHSSALLSQSTLTEDWDRPEEDAAWGDLPVLQQLATLTGESPTTTIIISVRERLDRLQDTRKIGLAEWLQQIGRETAPLFKPPYDTIDHGDLLYNEDGLPK